MHTYNQLIQSIKPAEKEITHKQVRTFFKIGIAAYCLLEWNKIQKLVEAYCYYHHINYNTL